MKLRQTDKGALTNKVMNCIIMPIWLSLLMKSTSGAHRMNHRANCQNVTKKKKKSKREKESGAAGKGLINRLSITSLFSSVSGSMAKLQVYSYLWGLPCLTWQGKAGAVNSSGCYEPLISLANEACNLAKPRALWTADTIQTTNRKNANALMNLEGKGGKKKRK